MLLSCVNQLVGLVMVQVISNLGIGSGLFNAVVVVRPVFVSLGFGLLVPMACYFVVLPITKWLNKQRAASPDSFLSRLLVKVETAFVIHTAFLITTVTTATYAGTSNLFAAYLTGAAISWWDSDVLHNDPRAESKRPLEAKAESREPSNPSSTAQGPVEISNSHGLPVGAESIKIENQGVNGVKSSQSAKSSLQDALIRYENNYDKTSGIATFKTYCHQPLQRVLKPFFFASIGFSIPITLMFSGSAVWRGFLYTMLMVIGKLACGLWLVRLGMPNLPACLLPRFTHSAPKGSNATALSPSKRTENEADPGEVDVKMQPAPQQVSSAANVGANSNQAHQTASPAKPFSIYPGAIVGCAMVARGEIGFLISSLAETNGIYGEEANGLLFLTVTWAILLCTILGPVCVGLIVKRLRALSRGMEGKEGRDMLGVWGLK